MADTNYILISGNEIWQNCSTLSLIVVYCLNFAKSNKLMILFMFLDDVRNFYSTLTTMMDTSKQ